MWAWLWAVVAWACLMDCSAWSSDGMHHNFATTRKHTPDWTFASPKNVRRTHLHRLWQGDSADHPYLSFSQHTPRPPHHSQLRGNGFLLGDEDYDDVPSSTWFGQSNTNPHRNTPNSLQGLQRVLEKQVIPSVREENTRGGSTLQHNNPSGDPFRDSHQRQHQREFGEDLHMYPRGGIGGRDHSADLASHQEAPPTVDRYDYPQQALSWPRAISKDILQDLVEQLAVEPLSHPGQLPGELLGKSQYMEGENLADLTPHLTDIQHSKSLPKDDFLRNLLNKASNSDGNSQADMMNQMEALDYPDHATLPDLLTSHHQGLGEFMTHNGYTPATHNSHLPSLSQQGSDSGGGSVWVPSSASRLTFPSAKALTKTCHARHLHSCGARVIEEFSHQPDYAHTCRIREEFLDCMENEQKQPCLLQGEHFTQEKTRRIIDRIKKLLWSARGCILSHSP